MESFFKPISKGQFMKASPANLKSKPYDEHVTQVNEYFATYGIPTSMNIKRPSEVYMDDYHHEKHDDVGEISLNELRKNEWSDQPEKLIMKGRHHSIGVDYLTATGQHLRDIVCDTILFNLMIDNEFNESNGKSVFRISRYVLHRMFTESILMSNGVEIEPHSTSHIAEAFSDLHLIFEEITEDCLKLFNIDMEDIVHEDVWQINE